MHYPPPVATITVNKYGSNSFAEKTAPLHVIVTALKNSLTHFCVVRTFRLDAILPDYCLNVNCKSKTLLVWVKGPTFTTTPPTSASDVSQ